jgi:hypothetical protein
VVVASSTAPAIDPSIPYPARLPSSHSIKLGKPRTSLSTADTPAPATPTADLPQSSQNVPSAAIPGPSGASHATAHPPEKFAPRGVAPATPPLGASAAHEVRFSARSHSAANTGTSAADSGAAEAQGATWKPEVVVTASVVGGAAIVVAGGVVVVGGVVSLQARITMKRKGPIQPDFLTWSL